MFLALAVVAVAWINARSLFPTMRVTVVNHGPQTLHNVVVHVAGNSYPFGDMRPGSRVSRYVSPKSKSHVEIEFTHKTGHAIRLRGSGYFQPGYTGELRYEIEQMGIVSVRNIITISRY
jgi:hypothetical protein